ncbi:sigma-70 family RNA polymerase sigma factor [Streptomyces sp. NPDC001634]|uniref:sigma-70 family RNA polymerase sigma factor n=1 Tax=Streptomyces sp. NPDC001634 TaxID=3154390 RepID=UPI00332D8850
MTTQAHAVSGGPTTREPALITRAKQGDPEAFGELYRMHHDVIATYIGHRLTSNPTLAEDLTADVFMKAWAKIGTFRWTGTPIRAWLCTIAHNVIADHFKIAATRRLTFVDQITHVGDAWTTPVSATEETVLSTLDVVGLHDALSGITPRQQAVIRLRFLGELSVSETARTLGTTDAAVKTLQWRALDSLRKAYAGAAA